MDLEVRHFRLVQAIAQAGDPAARGGGEALVHGRDWFAGYVRDVCLRHDVAMPELQSLDLEIAAELAAMGNGVMPLQAASRTRPGIAARPGTSSCGPHRAR